VFRFRHCETDMPSGTRLNRYTRWSMELSDLMNNDYFDITFSHIAGPENKLCDWISRWIEFDERKEDKAVQTTSSENTDLCLMTTNTMDISDAIREPDIYRAMSAWEEDCTSAYLKGVALRDIYLVKLGRAEKTKKMERFLKRFAVEEGVPYPRLIYRTRGKNVVVIPDVKIRMTSGVETRLRLFLVQMLHETVGTHRGIIQTMEYARMRIWFPRMDLMISSWIGSCEMCAISNKTVGGQFSGRVVDRPNQCVLMDFCEWEGQLVLVVIDTFTTFAMAMTLNSKTAYDTAGGFLRWCSLFGFPESLAMDNDPSFRNDLMNSLLRVYNVKELDVPVYTPTSQGLVERMVGSLKSSLDLLRGVKLPFEALLAVAVFAHNSYRRGTHGLSPINVMLGIEGRDPLSHLTGDNFQSVQAEDPAEYASKVRVLLDTLRNYWAQVTSSQREKGLDSKTFPFECKLEVGDVVLRVVKMNGRRVYRGRGRVRARRGESYEIEMTDGSTEIAPGYQLILFKPNEEHEELRKVLRTSDDDLPSRAGVGDEVSAVFATDQGRLKYIGRVAETLPTGYLVDFYEVDERGRWHRNEISERALVPTVCKEFSVVFFIYM
jgi:hypothetical protein